MEFVDRSGEKLIDISCVAKKIKLTERLVKIYNHKFIGYWKRYGVYFLELLRNSYDTWKNSVDVHPFILNESLSYSFAPTVTVAHLV